MAIPALTTLPIQVMRRGLAWVGGLAAIALLAGCAASPTAPKAATNIMGPTGTIISSRQVIPQIAGGKGGVLGALGASESARETLVPATEFIVREASGRLMSVMQPQPTPLHSGEKVRILRGINTRLAPLNPPPSA